MEIYSFGNPMPSEPTPSGEPEAPTYKMQLDRETGHKTLMRDGKTNLYARIQEAAEACDINRIVARALEGDTEALNRVAGVYVDCTNMPSTLADMHQLIINAHNEFDSLPLEIREKFGQSVDAYINEYGSDKWAEKLGIVQSAEPDRRSTTEKNDNMHKERGNE